MDYATKPSFYGNQKQPLNIGGFLAFVWFKDNLLVMDL